MSQVFSNYFETRLNEELDVAATSVAVQSVANMPVLGVGEYLYLTIFSTTTREIVKVTAIDVPSLTITIERGKDSTTAITWPSGSKIAYMVCKIILDEILSAVSDDPGKVKQFKCTPHTAYISTTSSIPSDNSDPQNTEGSPYTGLDTSITPTNGDNDIIVEVEIPVFGCTGNTGVVALFKDSEATAVAFGVHSSFSSIRPGNIKFSYREPAVDTSERSFTLRYGSDPTNTAVIGGNNVSSGELGNTAKKNYMKIWEIEP